MVRLAVTLGDPAGIGPEIVETAVSETASADVAVTVVGPAGLAQAIAERTGASAIAAGSFDGAVGEASAQSGRAALAALDAAIDMARVGEVDALVTGPVSKRSMALAQSRDHGQTPILARELADGPVAMAFLSERLRVVLATDHIPFDQIARELTPQRIVDVARLLAQALTSWKSLQQPRLALAALNPHASDDGLFGDEESHILVPAVELARSSDLLLEGPYPADSIFRRAYDGAVDGVVALYHDQGLTPVKMLGLGASVHTTLGLRVPRTSPDHGTAFDRVGTGAVSSEGMVAALRLAIELAQGRRMRKDP